MLPSSLLVTEVTYLKIIKIVNIEDGSLIYYRIYKVIGNIKRGSEVTLDGLSYDKFIRIICKDLGFNKGRQVILYIDIRLGILKVLNS